MLTTAQILAFLLTAVMLTATPGPDNLMVLSIGMSKGRRAGIAFGLGCALGCLSHTVLAVIGVGALLVASPMAFTALKWAGGAYLIWLGIQQWRAAGSINLNTLALTQNRGHLFKRAVFVNLTNPKSIVFLAALFPQFIVPHQPQVMQYVVLGATTIIVDIIVMIGYATLAQRIAAWIKGPKQMKALNKVFGSLFMLVGALLASARHA